MTDGWQRCPQRVWRRVAVWQIHLAHADHLSPWKGGGFGMFASTDRAANRKLRVYLRRGASAVEMPVPSGDSADRARLHPTSRRLASVAREVARNAGAELGPVDAVPIEVWRRRFEPESLEPHPILLRQLEVAPVGNAH